MILREGKLYYLREEVGIETNENEAEPQDIDKVEDKTQEKGDIEDTWT